MGRLVLATLACWAAGFLSPAHTAEQPWHEAIVVVLDKIIVPRVDFDQVPLEEAVDFVRQSSVRCDPEPEPAKRGVSLLIVRKREPGPAGLAAAAANPRDSPRVTLRAKDICYSDLLAELSLRAGFDVWLTDFGIVLAPPGVAPFPNGKAADGRSRKWFSADGRERRLREEKVEFAGASFRVVRVAAGRLGVVWQGSDGTPLRTFERAQAEFSQAGKRVRLLTNAGIFATGGVPCGLHVENGKTLRPLNDQSGEGNFHLQPNGVFAVFGHGAKARAFVGDRQRWQATLQQAGPADPLALAVQSGPLLLLGGKRHPAFRAGSANRLSRNGVGVDQQGRVVFAITAEGQHVNFHDFAGLFLHLGCRDALFLDGVVSQMAVEPTAPEPSRRFGAMFAVAE